MNRPVRHPQVAFLLGKPVRGTSVLAEVVDRLRALPAAVAVHVPTLGSPPPERDFGAHLVVQRGLAPAEQTAALPLEVAGVRCCNRLAATLAAYDRARTRRALAATGVPVPAFATAMSWPELVALAGGRPVVAKAAHERVGRGLAVLLAPGGDLPPAAPFPGPYLAEDYVPGDGWDHKLYVAGAEVRGIRKPAPAPGLAPGPGVPFAVDPELADLARRVGASLGLEIYGVDVLRGPAGPTVVDVNPFPGFRGVPDAARLVADYLSTLIVPAARGDVPPRG